MPQSVAQKCGTSRKTLVLRLPLFCDGGASVSYYISNSMCLCSCVLRISPLKFALPLMLKFALPSLKSPLPSTYYSTSHPLLLLKFVLPSLMLKYALHSLLLKSPLPTLPILHSRPSTLQSPPLPCASSLPHL